MAFLSEEGEGDDGCKARCSTTHSPSRQCRNGAAEGSGLHDNKLKMGQTANKQAPFSAEATVLHAPLVRGTLRTASLLTLPHLPNTFSPLRLHRRKSNGTSAWDRSLHATTSPSGLGSKRMETQQRDCTGLSPVSFFRLEGRGAPSRLSSNDPMARRTQPFAVARNTNAKLKILLVRG